jgi:hypothetical protein
MPPVPDFCDKYNVLNGNDLRSHVEFHGQRYVDGLYEFDRPTPQFVVCTQQTEGASRMRLNSECASSDPRP